jgi:hypothetical protein
MAKFRGKALLPWPFVKQYIIPGLFRNLDSWYMFPQQFRKYFENHDPEKDTPVGQISLR